MPAPYNTWKRFDMIVIINKKSWHYYIANKYGSLRILDECEDISWFSYVFHVLTGMVWVWSIGGVATLLLFLVDFFAYRGDHLLYLMDTLSPHIMLYTASVISVFVLLIGLLPKISIKSNIIIKFKD